MVTSYDFQPRSANDPLSNKFPPGGRSLRMKVLAWGQDAPAARARAAGCDLAAGQADLFERADVLSLGGTRHRR
jgi:hypothetical protein